MNSELSFKELSKRIEKLEQAVFGEGTAKKPIARTEFKGATGGLRFLIGNGFFDRKRLFTEAVAEMQKHGYHYSRQAVQTPLTRLSRVGGPLVSLDEKGKKVYAKRR